MKFIILLCLCALFVHSCTPAISSDIFYAALDVFKHHPYTHPGSLEDAHLLVPQLIEKYNYPSQTHTVTTKDGYVLTINRIPYGKRGPTKNRPVVFLVHGLLGSSADWILTGPDNGFAYILADAGYDVWLGNARGNRYSRKHTSLDPDTNATEFWAFSWHEIGVIDNPTMIDYITAYTKQKKIFYVGHSQGTTSFFVMASERPKYNDKIRAMVAFAPVAYMKEVTSPLVLALAPFEQLLRVLVPQVGLYEFLSHTELLSLVGSTLCRSNSSFQGLCSNTLSLLFGFDSEQYNATVLPIIMGHEPAGASTFQLLHYLQEVNSGQFSQWDYGSVINMIKYRSKSPPKYNLRNVKAPVYLYYSLNDLFSNKKDVLKLAKQLPNVQGKFLDEKFSHLDYLFGTLAPDVLYRKVLSLMKKH